MPSDKSFASFAKRISFRSEQVVSSTERLTRTATHAALASGLVGTPKLTGQAVNNWFVAEGSPDIKSVIFTAPKDIGDKQAEVIARASGTINGYTIVNKALFITNNLPYILSLDKGSSAKASEGMTTQMIEAARQVFRNPKKFFS